MIDYIHDTPGRLRVRCPRLRKELKKAAELKVHLGAVAGVMEVTVNPHTGSVTIIYDPVCTRTSVLMNVMKTHGCVPVATATIAPQQAPNPRLNVSGQPRAADQSRLAKAAAGFLLEKAIERSLTALVSAVL
jgi:hypothetical protein